MPDLDSRRAGDGGVDLAVDLRPRCNGSGNAIRRVSRVLNKAADTLGPSLDEPDVAAGDVEASRVGRRLICENTCPRRDCGVDHQVGSDGQVTGKVWVVMSRKAWR